MKKKETKNSEAAITSAVAEGEEEKVNVRHTITAEETFTLAKDVFDIRCFIKNVYNNRAVISRRLNILTLSASAAFTALYLAYMIAAGLVAKLSVSAEIVIYTLISVYAALCVTLLIISVLGGRTKTRGASKLFKALKIFRLLARVAAIAVSVAALSLSVTGGDYAAPKVAIDIVIIVLSIITLIIQLIPLLFGGAAKLARWLLSPVKIKYRFSYVVLEWYELYVSGKKQKTKTVKKVSKRYRDKIGVVVDEILIPELGDKYINSIKPATLLNLVCNVSSEDRYVVEGVLKSLFAYAAECGYVTFDPCKDLDFEGTVEERKKKTMKERIAGIGKKIGMSVLDKYIADNSDSESR